MKFLSAPLVLMLALAAPGSARDRKAVPAAAPLGPPVSCIPLRQVRESAVRDDRTIDFITGNRRAYRVTLPDACPGLGFEQAFSYATSLSQLCQQDIITVLHQGGGLWRGASCGLGPFQPVELARRR